MTAAAALKPHSAKGPPTGIETDLVLDRRGPLRPERLAPSRARVQGRGLSLAFRALDTSLLAMTAFAGLFFSGGATWTLAVTCALFFALPLWALSSLRAYGFKTDESLAVHLARVGAAFGVSCAIGLAVLWPIAGLTSLPTAWFAAGTALILAIHIFAWAIVRQARAEGRLTSNIVIVGAGRNAERLVEAALATGDVAILGVFDDRAARAPKAIHGVPVLGDTDALLDHKIMPFVDKIVIAVPETAEVRVRQLIDRLSVLPNDITLFVDDAGAARPQAVARLAGAPLAYMSGKPNDVGRALVKRAQDLVIGTAALIVAMPIMAATALAVRLDSPGPIFFRQRRHGFNNEEIVIWKFRSMRADAADARAARQISAGDDRVTRVGRFIRATSLDELPQIINVLKGEMSLVGPRPHAIGMMTGEVESHRLVAQYAHRHRMKPGMTGWAAIHGSRGPVDTPELVRERVAYDVEYIERQSFWLDLYVIAMTIPCLLGDRSAVR